MELCRRCTTKLFRQIDGEKFFVLLKGHWEGMRQERRGRRENLADVVKNFVQKPQIDTYHQ
eukprot:763390-Hanusia_phi.AAC.3